MTTSTNGRALWIEDAGGFPTVAGVVWSTRQGVYGI